MPQGKGGGEQPPDQSTVTEGVRIQGNMQLVLQPAHYCYMLPLLAFCYCHNSQCAVRPASLVYGLSFRVWRALARGTLP